MRRAWLRGAVLALALAATTTAAQERVPLAEVNGETIYVDEVEGALALRIYRHRLDIHSLLVAEAERRIEARLLEEAARERGVTVEALLAPYETGGAPVSEEAIDRYLAEHPPSPGLPPERARERVRQYLGERERIDRRLTFMAELRRQAGARVLLEAPERPRTDFDVAGLPARGPDTADIVVVHFTTFSSRHGARSAAKLARLAQAFPGRIRRVHVHLLNDRDETGLHAARLASAVSTAAPDRFWPLHDALFAREGKLDPTRVDAIALESGIDAALIARASDDPQTLGAVKRDIERALGAGVPREPGLFVNGLFVSGLVPYEELHALVVEELAAQKNRSSEDTR